MSTTETEPETEEITVTCTWETTHRITVPRGFRIPSNLSDFPEDALEEMRCDGTEHLVDWR
jgi:hypothetical protein